MKSVGKMLTAKISRPRNLRESGELGGEDVAQTDGKRRQDEKVAAVGKKHVPFEEGGEADDGEGIGGGEELEAADAPRRVARRGCGS